MNPVIIPAQAPLPAFEVVPLQIAETIARHIVQFKDIETVNASNIEHANTVVLALHNDSKALTAHVDGIKKPLNQLIKAVRDCAENAEAPLLAAKRDLQAKIMTFNTAEHKRVAEARRIAEEQAAAARAEAEAERVKLQAIADAEHAKQVSLARERAEADAKLIAELMGTVVEAKPIVITPAPIIQAAPVVIAPVIEAAKTSAVATRKTKVLVITNPKLIPITVGGVEIRPIDELKLKTLLLSGVNILGAHIEERESVVMGRSA